MQSGEVANFYCSIQLSADARVGAVFVRLCSMCNASES